MERDGGIQVKASDQFKASAVVKQEEPAAQSTQTEGGQIMRIHYSGNPGSRGFARLLNFLAYFHGNMPVEVMFESDKSVRRLDDICRIQPDEAILNKLAELVGADNIEII